MNALKVAQQPAVGKVATPTYIYRDSFGEPVYRKVRYDNPKRFVFESKTSDGSWKTGLNGTSRVLYRLPELIQSPSNRVWIPEGEKDVDNLAALGLTATTSGGTSDPWPSDFNKYFLARDVVILTDADGPGWARGDKLAAELAPVAKTVRVVSFTGLGLPDGADVSDWLEAGHTLAELEALADATPAVDRSNRGSAFTSSSASVAESNEDRLTEAGTAERFVRLHGDDVRYDHRRECWLLWDEHRWRQDADAAVTRLALDFTRTWQREAMEIPEPERRQAVFKAAIRLERREALASMLALAHDLKPIADAGTGWDGDPYLLGVPNGVVELRTGELRAGRREDRISLATGVAYDFRASSTLWEATLKAILLDDAIINFFQVAAGYSITGDYSLDRWFLGSGDGRNGKGTLAHPISHALGDYALELTASVFDLRADRVPYELARLPGRRLVMASEVGDSVRLNHDRIKQITGGDKMTVANKYERPFEFQPTSKLWIFCNRKPRVTDDSPAFWSRVLVLPFTVSFRGREDTTLRPKLTQDPVHQAAVLAWLVGAVRYLSSGLGTPPDEVREATNEYRNDQDILGPFLDQACELEPEAESGASALYEHYTKWAEAQHLTLKERLTSTAFGRLMSGRFKWRKDRTLGIKWYRGIAIRNIF